MPDMSVFEFCEKLRCFCTERKAECHGCPAMIFCYSTPKDYTEDMIRDEVERLQRPRT